MRQIADRVAVMYLGEIVEIGSDGRPCGAAAAPVHRGARSPPIPRADGAGVLPVDLPGDVPDPAHPPTGCRFHPRCPIALDECRSLDQYLVPVAGREIACHVRSGGTVRTHKREGAR